MLPDPSLRATPKAALCLFLLAVMVLPLWGTAAHPQSAHAQPQNTQPQGKASSNETPPSNDEVGPYLQEIVQLTEEAVATSQSAAQAETVGEVKASADAVFEALWGRPSGLSAEESRGASFQHGWKTRWQTTPAAFDSAYAARYSEAPPEIEDPQQLGIFGRGLYVRTLFAVRPDSAGPDTPGRHFSHDAIVAPLSNAIGWMRLDNGITKGELQPRIDLTYKWDAPIEFWQSTADTGWLNEAYAQATNILKTDYEGDAAMARAHAATLTQLLEKALDGVDANQNGTVEPVMMEGGLRAALHEAEAAGLTSENAGRSDTPEMEENAAEPAANSPVGTWTVEVDAAAGTIPATLNIAGEQGGYHGAITAEDGAEAELQDVAMSGSELSFRFQHPQYGTIRLNATIEGDAFSGSLDAGGDTVPVSGTRTSTEANVE